MYFMDHERIRIMRPSLGPRRWQMVPALSLFAVKIAEVSDFQDGSLARAAGHLPHSCGSARDA